MLTIDIEGDELILILPSGKRSLAVPATAAGLTYIKRILLDAKRIDHEAPPKGYIREYPTQHVIELWMRQDRARQQAEREIEVEEKYGIKLDSLEIRL